MHLPRSGSLLLVVIVAGSIVSGCSSSSSGGASPSATSPRPVAMPPQPPAAAAKVTEAFTLLPCPAHTPTNTLQIEGCSEHRIVALDRQINSAVSAIFTSLPAASRGRVNLAQLAWISYRKATCESESDVYSGGTLAPLVYANCEVRVDKERLADLHALQRETSGP